MEQQEQQLMKLEGTVEHVIYENADSGYAVFEVDAGGTDYRVIWTDVDYETEDESEACDWDDPDYVLEA